MINSFDGGNRFLSNFWMVKVMLDGEAYQSVEHAYQAAKSNDPEYRARIRACYYPSETKKLGKTVALRPDWDAVKLDIMEDLVKQKFNQVPLNHMLLYTKDQELIEGNWWGDTFWGVCRGVGQNHLGKILMKIREELRCGTE